MQLGVGNARKRWTYWLHAWAFMVGALAAAPARAYELKEPAEGTFVRWTRGDVALHVPYAEAVGTVDADALWDSLLIAADAWRHIGGAPPVRLVAGGPPAPDPHDGLSSVHVLSEWPAETYGDRLAVTVSTFDPNTGELRDTDVLINGTRTFGVLDEAAPATDRFDLPSVLTHELGHVLGLDESEVPEATMWPLLLPGQVSPRTLDTDDEQGIVALYGAAAAPTPEQTVPLTCDAGPRPERGSWLAVLALVVTLRSRGLASLAFAPLRSRTPKR